MYRDIRFYFERMKHPTLIVFIADKGIASDLNLVASTRKDCKWISYYSDVVFVALDCLLQILVETNNREIIEAPHHWPFVSGMHHSPVNSNKKANNVKTFLCHEVRILHYWLQEWASALGRRLSYLLLQCIIWIRHPFFVLFWWCLSSVVEIPVIYWSKFVRANMWSPQC